LGNSGSILKEKRKSLGITLEQISEELRIKLQYLEALEDEKYELLPAPLYKKIFIKAYADYLGLNFDELLDEFKKKREENQEDTELYSREISSKGVKNSTSLLVIIAIFLGFISFFVFLKHRKPETDYQKQASEAVTVKSEEQSPNIQPPSEKIDEEQIPIQAKGMTLKLEGTGKSWGLVLGGKGDTLFSGFISEGMVLECKTEEQFKITLGRAWLVKGYLNGKKLKPFAEKGKSIYGRVISKENYEGFLEEAE